MSLPFYGSHDVVLSDHAIDNLAKIKDLIAHKPSKLMVISDFDHTLTKFTSLQCHDVVGFNKRYSKEFLKEFNDIFLTPLESLSEWWRVAHDLLVDKSGLTKEMLHERLSEEIVAVRDGLEEFIIDLRLHHIPLIIVSAGIRDVIAHTLAKCNLCIEHDELFHIDANFLEFHDCGKLSNVLPEDPVHSESKKLVHVRAGHMFDFLTQTSELSSDPVNPNSSNSYIVNASSEQDEEQIDLIVLEPDNATTTGTTRTTTENQQASTQSGENSDSSEVVIAIVLGDRSHDFAVLDAYPEVHTFRIGFARNNRPSDTADLLQAGHCDAVLVGEEHSLYPVHLLLQDLIHCRLNSGHHTKTILK